MLVALAVRKIYSHHKHLLENCKLFSIFQRARRGLILVEIQRGSNWKRLRLTFHWEPEHHLRMDRSTWAVRSAQDQLISIRVWTPKKNNMILTQSSNIFKVMSVLPSTLPPHRLDIFPGGYLREQYIYINWNNGLNNCKTDKGSAFTNWLLPTQIFYTCHGHEGKTRQSPCQGRG